MGELESGFAELDSRLAELEAEIAGLEARVGTNGRPAPVAPAAPVEVEVVVPQPRGAPAEERIPNAPTVNPASAPASRKGLTLLVGGGSLIALLVVGFLVFGPDDASVPTPRTPVGSATVKPLDGFSPPVDVPAGDSYVRSLVLASGDLQVVHWIRSSQPVTSLTLAVPTVAGLDPDSVQAADLEVIADGTRLDGPTGVTGDPQTIELDGATTIVVSYVLSGATERSSQDTERALARVTSLALHYLPGGGSTVTRSVQGVDVSALACSSTTDLTAAPTACGTEQDGVWATELTGAERDDQVMAQFNLPGA